MAKKNSDGLTPLQVRYCQERAKGETQRQAYIKAGYSSRGNDQTLDSNASRLESDPKISAKIEYLQSMVDNNALLTTEQRQAALVDIYLDDSKGTNARLKALDMLNRMAGDYVDKQQIDATVSGLTREDRRDAMQDTLNALKSAWNKDS